MSSSDYLPGSFLDLVACNFQDLRDWLRGNDGCAALSDLRVDGITAGGGKLCNGQRQEQKWGG